MRFYADPVWVLLDLPMVSYTLCKPLVFRLLNIFNDSVNKSLGRLNLINISNHLILHSCGYIQEISFATNNYLTSNSV